jgi:ribonuclease VapC
LILDSSAVIAMLLKESDHRDLDDRVGAAASVEIGAPALFETAMVMLSRMGDQGLASLMEFLERFRVEVIPFGDSHWRIAAEAFGRFGKGRHPAALNLGDCMTYATALIEDGPLLYVGSDFARTDLQSA